jgi:hypothetical protein
VDDLRPDLGRDRGKIPLASGCSIVVGDLPSQREMAPGFMRGLQLVVTARRPKTRASFPSALKA